MLSDQFLDILSHWEVAVPVAMGLTVAAAALVCGKILIARKARQAEQPAAASADYDPFVEGSKTERRSSVRRRGNHVAVILGDANGETELGRAWVVDRSMGGLCLSSEVPLDTAQIVTVKPVSAPGSVFWTQVEVRSCRNNDNIYEVGCRFIKTPSWNQLLYFG